MIKKIVSIIILLFYFCSNVSFGFSELYYLKGTKVDNIEPFVISGYEKHNFNILKRNPYYGISQNNSSSASVILQQNGDDVLYFYNSDDYKKINKDIVKLFKSNNINCEKSYNSNIINVYEELVKKSANNKVENYVFTQEDNNFGYENPYSQRGANSTNYAGNNLQQDKEVPVKLQNSLRGYVAQISSGVKFGAYLQNPINTAVATVGEKVTAVLTSNVNYNGYTVFPQGSVLYGELVKARHAAYGSRNGRVVINFNQLVTPDNKVYNISAEKIDFTVTNDGKVASVAENAAVGALIGGLVGLLFGALGSDNIGTAVAVGAGVGAGSAIIGGAAERGIDAEIPSFTEIEIKLTAPVNVTINY